MSDKIVITYLGGYVNEKWTTILDQYWTTILDQLDNNSGSIFWININLSEVIIHHQILYLTSNIGGAAPFGSTEA